VSAVGMRILPVRPSPLPPVRERGAEGRVRVPCPRAGALVPRPRDYAPAGALQRPPETGRLCQLTSDAGHKVEVNAFFQATFLKASQSAVEKWRLPEKAPPSSARIDAKSRAHLHGFHYTRHGGRGRGQYDRRLRRGGIAKKDIGGKHILFILAPDSRLLPFQSQAAQAGHETELYARMYTRKPQSLWGTRLCARYCQPRTQPTPGKLHQIVGPSLETRLEE
jgi:hypothetical protein